MPSKTAAPRPSAKLTPFGKRFRRLIYKAGFRSRNAFLKAASLDNMTVYRWEIGAVEPHLDNLRHVASVLGVTLDDLKGNATGAETYIEMPPTYPALEQFLKTPIGKGTTPEERAQLAEYRAKHEPTLETYQHVLAAIRSEKRTEAEQELDTGAAGRALAKGGKPLKRAR